MAFTAFNAKVDVRIVSGVITTPETYSGKFFLIFGDQFVVVLQFETDEHGNFLIAFSYSPCSMITTL